MLRNLAVLFLSVCPFALGQTPLVPSTTLAAETSNNTSASDTFQGWANGTPKPRNVSKLPLRSLMYDGSETKLHVHFMPWFGHSGHKDVGYRSDDPEQVRRQVKDMISRGIDGAIIDWYGPGRAPHDTATMLIKEEAERNPGFEFAVCEDKGALSKCAETPGCEVTEKLISDFTYVANTYFTSPAYMRTKEGRPVLHFFGVEAYNHLIDWDKVRANVPGNPVFIFRNSVAYTAAQTNGGYAWLVNQQRSGATDGYMSLPYLTNFYQVAQQSPAQHTWGSAFKGFDDSYASWGKGRYIGQYCGKTWLSTWAHPGKFYSSVKQLEAMQIVTWNDYEEGTPIEVGIESCLSLVTSMAGSTVSWSLAGDPANVDHFLVFVSTDGENLAQVAKLPVSARSFDLDSVGLGAGRYNIFVKAAAKAGLFNAMSNRVDYVPGNAAPTVALAMSTVTAPAPASVTADASGSTDADGTVATSSIDFGDGTVAAGPVASHTYSAPGTYQVVATVTDDSGASSTATTRFTATNTPPMAQLELSATGGGAPFTLTASAAGSTDADGSVVSTRIDFGDGTVVNGPVASRTYNTSGTYTVTAIATDNHGARSRHSAAVTVAGPAVTVTSPAANASVAGAIRVTAASTGPAPITGMTVYMDNASVHSTSASSLDTTLTASPGAHTVTIKAWDVNGAVGIARLSVNVANQAPQIAFDVTPAIGEAPLTVTATTAGSTDADGSVAAARIVFGEGAPVPQGTATHTFAVPGTYVVMGKVYDNLNLSATATRTVVVLEPNLPPAVTLDVSTSGGNAPVTVNASLARSTDPEGALASYSIDLGNGTIANTASASATYTVAGTYTIVATVTDAKGAAATTSHVVTVQPKTVTINSRTAGATVNTPVRVTASAASGLLVKAMKVYVDGVAVFSASGAAVDTTISPAAGTRRLTVVAWDESGEAFKSSLYFTAMVPNVAPIAKLAATPTGGYAPLAVSASAAGSYDPDGSIAASSISFGEGTVVNGTSGSTTYNIPGTYTVTASVSDNAGATATASQVVTVKAPEIILVTPLAESTVLSPVRVQASAHSGRAIRYMQIYVDGVKTYTIAAASLDTSVRMNPGRRRMTVQAYDGVSFIKKTVYLNVK